MTDANGHALNVNDIVHPDNDLSTTLKINAFDGTLCDCRAPDALGGPVMRFLPVHLIWVSTPA